MSDRQTRPAPRMALGPGAMVTAAFIGPGTVTACTLAGAGFGYGLIWALVFSTLAAMVLQEMAARLGLGGRLGLGEALLAGEQPLALKLVLAGLILTAVGLGNTAYQAGNIAGGALGLGLLTDWGWLANISVIGAVAGLVLFFGGYRVIERVLIGLVLAMALAFLAAAVLVRPDLGALAAGLVPHVPAEGLSLTLALIGTTIVPYNLFLHAAAARERWPAATETDLAEARMDTRVSLAIGGVISIAVLATAASGLFAAGLSVNSPRDLALALEPVYGPAAPILLGLGLFGAGLTSAITAPLAAAYVVREVLPQPRSLSPAVLFKGTALLVLALGLVTVTLNPNVVSVIIIAQVANGLMLPIVASFLLWTMNRRALLGGHVNGAWSNSLGAMVIGVTLLLGLRGVLRGLGVSIF